MCVVSGQPLPTEAKLIVVIKHSQITNLWTLNLLYDVSFEIESFFCIVYPRWEPTKWQYIVGVNHIKFKRYNYGIILKSICTVESSVYKIFLVNLRPKINMKPKNKVYNVLDCIIRMQPSIYTETNPATCKYFAFIKLNTFDGISF